MFDKKNPPIAKFRDRGITVNVWERTTTKGIFHDVTFERSYKEGDEWRKTVSIPSDEVQNLCKLLDLAHTAILERREEIYAQGKEMGEDELPN